MRVDMIIVKGNGPLVGANGLIETALDLEGDTEVAVPIGYVWRCGETLLDERDGLLVSTLLIGEDTSVVQGERMVRGNLEDLLVERARLVQLVGLLQADRNHDRLFETQLSPS